MPSTGRVLNLEDVIDEDTLASEIARIYTTWETGRQSEVDMWRETRHYIYATDTTQTSNAKLPWKNTTTVPKLTQIADNLIANYMASLFPKRKWLVWEGATQTDEIKAKADSIRSYMMYVINQKPFKETILKLIIDYVMTGNAFVSAAWEDQRVLGANSYKLGYVGPVAKRTSPFDIVMNPVAPNAQVAPKITRSIVSLGELKKRLSAMTSEEGDQEQAQALWDYLTQYREQVLQFAGDLKVHDDIYNIDGFTSYRHYLESDYVELLTFQGDWYSKYDKTLQQNRIITVVDRHKIVQDIENPTNYGFTPIFHAGWRYRPDNLWAMGPLANLVGMQYRIDHIENLKADLFDLTAFPPLKIKGYVEEFDWAPFEKIVIGDEGDVELLKVDVNPLAANFELDRLQNTMEEMAGAPKEAMGFRTPGEKTKYEVQRLENAASRIFQHKIVQFEEQILEPLLNAMLEMAQRRLEPTTLRVLDDEFKIATFINLTPEDILAAGRIRPVAARHFAERAEMIQNVTNFYQSGPGMDETVRLHISSIEIAKLFEELLEIEDRGLVQPYIRLTEQADAQRLANQHDENTMMAMSPEAQAGGPIGQA